MQIRRTAAALTSAAALSFTGVALATPAYAQPVDQDGLVNVAIVNVLNDNEVNVQVPVAAAINICDLNVIAVDAATGDMSCTATANSRARNRQ